jgi:hypothetical protein
MDPTSSLGGQVSLMFDMSAVPSSIQTGGQKSQIQVRLLNENGAAIKNETVAFETTLGTLTLYQAATDANGWAKTELRSGSTAGTASVTARHQLISTTTSVAFVQATDTTGYILQLTTDKNEILANGTSTADLTVQLIAKGTQSPAFKIVTLTTTAGSVPASAVLNQDGGAYVTLTSEAKSQDITATVTAAYGGQSVFVNILMKGVDFHVEASPLVLFADGTSVSTIRAFLRESATRIGIIEESVQFSTTLGIIQSQEQTDITGVATVQLVSGTSPGKATVIAYYGKTMIDTVQIDFKQPTYTLEISATPKSILADGLDYSTIHAVVKDEFSKPMSDQPVYFAATVGDIDYVVNTNSSGIAEAKLISAASSTDRSSTVTVTVNEVSKTLPVQFNGLQFSLTADPNYIVADGASQSTITALVRETIDKIGIENAEIRLGTNLGTIPGSVKTNNQGVAQVQLTSGKTQGTAQVIGWYGNLFSDTVLVQFGTSVPPSIQQIAANPQYVLANGSDQAWISVKVVDSNNTPVMGTAVNFSTTAGTIQGQEVTDKNGVATVSLVSSESATDVVSTVTARVGSQSVTTDVTFEGVQMSLTASPLSILADGRSTSTIKVVLKRTTSKIAVTNATVRFATDLGTIPSESATDNQGVVEVSLTSGTSVGTAHVTAQYGSTIKQNISINFQESIPTYLEVNPIPPVLPADGQSQSTIKATVSDQNRNPVSNGTLVLYEIVSGSGTLERQKTTTSGIATTQLTAGNVPGNVNIRVKIPRVALDTLTADVQVVCTVGEVYQVIVTSDKDHMLADGIQVANIQAKVVDAQGNPVSGQTVFFTTTIGDITPNAPTNAQGIATAQFSSGIVGTSTITAAVKRSDGMSVLGNIIVQLLPGSSNTIVLRFNPTWIGVKDTGQNQTMNVSADIKDGKNNPVVDGTLVKFSFIGSNLGCAFSTTQPIPTVGGTATISLSSGTRSGTIRVNAEVVDAQGQPITPLVSATSSWLLIHAGPPYIEDVNDLNTTHLTIAAYRLNIGYGMLDTTTIRLMVGDKYNNPVEKGTAVYFTTSGGVVSTHTAYTDEYGKASVLLTQGHPLPTIDRYYNYIGLQDPNNNQIVPGPMYYKALDKWLLPNFEEPIDPLRPEEIYPGIVGGRVKNSEGDSLENDGIARIIAYTEGMDAAGNSARPWDELSVVMSGATPYNDNSNYVFQTLFHDTLSPGDEAQIRYSLIDYNGNPIVSGTKFTFDLTNSDAKAKLNKYEDKTGNGWGTDYYYISITNTSTKYDSTDQRTGIKIKLENKWDEVTMSTFSSIVIKGFH